MLSQTQSEPITQECAKAMLKAVRMFPRLLAKMDPEDSARIVAEIIKTHVSTPEPEEDPMALLNKIVELAGEEE